MEVFLFIKIGVACSIDCRALTDAEIDIHNNGHFLPRICASVRMNRTNIQ